MFFSRRWLVLAVGGWVLGVGLLFYFSWIPDPALAKSGWLPEWVGKWADAHDRLRTGVALLGPGVCLGVWLSVFNRPRREWVWGCLTLIALVTVAEVGQLWLPKRVFDLRDIAWGALGAASGMGVVAALKKCREMKKCRMRSAE